MTELGYVEGRNLILEVRTADGHADQLPALVRQLVRLQVDVIVASSTRVIQAAKSATATIPIVMAGSGDPVGAVLVASLARPGGNITGLSLFVPELSGKRLELIREVVPGATRIAILSNPTSPVTAIQLKETQAAARSLAVQLQLVEARSVDQFESALTRAADQHGCVEYTG